MFDTHTNIFRHFTVFQHNFKRFSPCVSFVFVSWNTETCYRFQFSIITESVPPTLDFLGIVSDYTPEDLICTIIANTKKYVKSDWLRGVQYWPYLYSVFNICTLLLNKRKNKKCNIRFPWRKNRNLFIKNKLIVNH